MIPAEVLRLRGASAVDTIAFVTNDDGSMSLVKGTRGGATQSVGDVARIFI